MSQSYRLKLTRNALKLKVAPRIPAQLQGANFITITKANGVYTFDVDYSVLTPGPITDPTTAYIAIEDQTSGIYRTVSLSSLLTSGLDADLQAIAALTGTGILARTADGTWALRTLTAPAAGITITNPAGVAGNPTLVLANDLAAVEGLASNGMAARTATDTWAVRTITAGALMGVTNGDGVAGNPTIAVTDAELVALGGLASAADKLPYFTGSGTASLADFSAFARTLVDDADQATMRTTLGLTPGTDVQAFDSDLAAVAALSTTGLIARTGAGTVATRTLQSASAGLTWTNGDGISGNPVPVFANDLAAVEGLSGTGVARRTGVDTWSVGVAVALSELATQAAYTIVGNFTSSSAVPTASTIPALTHKAVPVGADKIMMADSAASDAVVYATLTEAIGAVASGVSSFNGATGAVVYLAGMHNRLINPSGAIWQRANSGAAAITDVTYAFDRWYGLTQSNGITASQVTAAENGTPYMMRLSQANASAQRFGIAQVIESLNSTDLRGQAVVLSARVRMSASTTLRYAIIEWTGTADTVTKDFVLDWTNGTFTAGQFFTTTSTTITSTGSTALTANTLASISLTGTIGSSANNVAVIFWTNSTQAQNVTLDVGKVQLEIGSTATPLAIRSQTTELADCQRYYFRRNSSATDDVVGLMQAWSTTQVFGKFSDLPVQMRVKPTAALSSLSHFSVNNATASTLTALSAGTLGSTSVNSISSQSMTAAGASLTAGNAVMLQFNSTSGWYDATAEL